MNKSILIFIILLIYLPLASAQDFLLEFVEENYKETQAQFSYHPLIYHSIQVNGDAGPKILVLEGDDYNYRKWLRYYIAENKQFILKVDNEKIDDFISAKVVKIDLTALHPFNKDKWTPKESEMSNSKILIGANYFLVIDDNETRNQQFKIIADKMGYKSVFFKTGEDALTVFKLQSEKFKMVVVDHAVFGMPAEKIIEKIISVNHIIPIVVDTGYNNPSEREAFISKFSGVKSVHIKPVILDNLQKTIKTLLNKKNA